MSACLLKLRYYSSNVIACPVKNSAVIAGSIRLLSSVEVSTALRPFYFSVHPDLFGKHPNERSINENSLMQLSSYLETLQRSRSVRPVSLKFYLRPRETSFKGSFQLVTLNLNERDTRNAVLRVLKSCNLPTTYVDNISPAPTSKTQDYYPTPDQKSTAWQKYESMFKDNDDAYGAHIIRGMVKKAKEDESLLSWLKNNIDNAAEKQAACLPIQEEVKRLQVELAQNLGLQEIIWDCGWNVTHFRGCLQSFQALARDHSELLHVLKGRTVVFGSDTGVSLNGNVLLSSGEVRHNWLDFLKHVWQQDAALLAIPAMQKAVSRVLRDIKVVHRKFQPNIMAKSYTSQLRRLVTSLSDYQGRQGYPKSWPQSLEKFELVVEPEAGPLMLSPTGQFIVPSSCPASLLVSFLSEHIPEAERLLSSYQMNKHVERDLHARCIAEFGLLSLRKEDNVTPDLMIACCSKLLERKADLLEVLKGRCLWITNYYSIMSDGHICIPWNWKI
ncbi:T-cell activation inhibitor, mitochondrial isoform X1 [Frankliniella occidentalis]|uniref:T-cell activation inhibitor, mitochondrial isoform X1 n=1 Tax=Frankliniella occidentalis TaxID=133901 RepID=A0A6J1SGN8_FRAOC|nr:T-cell activation inhibitor, mitochondrial isoform X1 [Frankliniella occidentalis]